MESKLIKELLSLEEEIEMVDDKKAKTKLKRKYNNIVKLLKKVF